MERFVTGFSKRYRMVPVDLYGKLSHLARPSNSKNPLPQTAHPEQLKAQPEPTNNSQSELWTEVQSQKQSRSRPRSQPQQQPLPSHLSQSESQINFKNRPKLKIVLMKGLEGDWSQNSQNSQNLGLPATTVTMLESESNRNVNLRGVSSVAEGVSTFLSGIRATFRQENIYVSGGPRQKESTSKNGQSHDGKQH